VNRGTLGGLGFVFWVENELPLPLIEEKGQGEIGADEGDDDYGCDGFHKPAMANRGL